MAQTLLFSIIIPAYNYAEVLPRAIRSVLRQSGNDWELIVINDGSTDNTSDVLREINSNDFSYIEQKNVGLAATRNNGINASSGNYLIFLDADDEMTEGALENFRAAIQTQPDVGIFIGGHESIYPSGRSKLHLPRLKEHKRVSRLRSYLIDKDLTISNGPTAMRRDIFSHYLYPEVFRCVEDIPMFAYVLANYEVSGIDKSMAKIYKHDDSLRHNTKLANEIGLQLVDEVFSEDRIPQEFQELKTEYSSHRSLSLFRTFFLEGNYDVARAHYKNAIQTYPKSLLNFSYLRKFLKSYLK